MKKKYWLPKMLLYLLNSDRAEVKLSKNQPIKQSNFRIFLISP